MRDLLILPNLKPRISTAASYATDAALMTYEKPKLLGSASVSASLSLSAFPQFATADSDCDTDADADADADADDWGDYLMYFGGEGGIRTPDTGFASITA
jgi:hypothetical protein